MVEREFGGGVGSKLCMAVGCFKHDVLMMVEREFGGAVGSNKCMAVGCFKYDVLMIQLSDHHKNPVG